MVIILKILVYYTFDVSPLFNRRKRNCTAAAAYLRPLYICNRDAKRSVSFAMQNVKIMLKQCMNLTVKAALERLATIYIILNIYKLLFIISIGHQTT